MYKVPRTMARKLIFPKISLQDIKGVLIDIDNTLYDYDFCHDVAIKKSFTFFNKSYKNKFTKDDFIVLYRKKRDLVTKKLSHVGSCRSRLLAFQSMLEDFQYIHNPYIFAYHLNNIYWSTLISRIRPIPRVKQFLIECKKQEIPVCAVTDMLHDIQIKKIIKLKFDRYIKYLVSSEEANCEKPNKKIFKLALAKLKLKSSDVIMIGDNIEKDCNGANAIGIKSFLIKSVNV